MTNSEKAALSRRTFVKGSALAGLGAAAMGSTSLFGCAPQGQGDAEGADLAATGETAPADEKIVWTHCHVNCGGACVLQCHVADDEIVSVESDNTGDASFGGFQARACLRGRSIRRWINGEDRLNYPMKRVEGPSAARASTSKSAGTRRSTPSPPSSSALPRPTATSPCSSRSAPASSRT